MVYNASKHSAIDKMPKNLSVKHWLCWGAFFAYLAFLFLYQSNHSRHIPLETGATFYDIWALQFGAAHTPFYAIPRMGFLLNTPLMMLGLSPHGIILFFIVLMAIAPMVLLVGIRPGLVKHPLFPLLSVLGYQLAFRPLDYETAPVVMSMLGLGLFFMMCRQHGLLRYGLMLTGALSFAYAGFANLGVLPAVLLTMLFLVLFYRDRISIQFALLSFFFLAALCFWFYGYEGQFERMLFGSRRFNQYGHAGSLIGLKFVFLTSFLLAVIAGVALAKALYELAHGMKKKFKMTACFIVALLAFLLVIFFTPTKIYYQAVFLMILSFAFACLGVFYQASLNRSWWVTLVVIYLLVMVHQTNTLAPGILVFLYLPYMLMLLGVWLVSDQQITYRVTMLLGCFVVTLIILGFYLFHYQLWQGVTKPLFSNAWQYRYPAYFGRYTTASSYAFYQGAGEAYAKHDCANKPFLVIANPGMYFKFKRLAPFDTPWISRESIVPDNRFVTDDSLIHWLNKQQSWCVIFTSTAPNRVHDGLKRYFLKRFEPYLKSKAAYAKYLGYDWHQNKNWWFYSG